MKGAELKSMLHWIEQNIQDNEPVLLKFPRREQRKRIQNLEKRRRISFVTSEDGYKEFHVLKEAWFQVLEENPSLFEDALLTCMREFNLLQWKDTQESAT